MLQTYYTSLLNPSNTAQDWQVLDPVLFQGEIGFESDTGLFKIGDGYSSWSELPYSHSAINELLPGVGIEIEDNIISAKLYYTIVEL